MAMAHKLPNGDWEQVTPNRGSKLSSKRGYYGVGIFHAKTEFNIGTLMRSAQCFGANFVFTVGRRYSRQASDTMDASSQIPCYHYRDMDDMKSHLPLGCRIVGVELAEGAREVGQYVHPNQCVYLLGAEDHGIPSRELSICHDVVVIPGTSRCLNVASAGSIVIFDRHRYFSTRRPT